MINEEQPAEIKPNRRKTLKILGFVGLTIFLCCGLCGGWVKYYLWYTDTIPTAPVPEGARLVEHFPSTSFLRHYSSQRRYWYVETYSVPLSPKEVEDFYEQTGDDAKPFGWTYLHKAEPLEDAVSGEETLFIVEVYWDTLPWPLGALGLY